MKKPIKLEIPKEEDIGIITKCLGLSLEKEFKKNSELAKEAIMKDMKKFCKWK